MPFLSTRAARLVVGLLLCGLAGAPAVAHNVVAAVYVAGATIEGEVGFSSGDMAAGAKVDVFTVDGEPLGTVVTDADGYFVFEATRRVDHVLRINLGAGHVAELEVAAADLPASLPGADGPGGGAVASTVSSSSSSLSPTARVTATQPPAADLQRIIQEAVAAQVRPLRKQLRDYENKVRLRDVLGGLGYILGLTGLGLYLLARRRRVSARDASGERR